MRAIKVAVPAGLLSAAQLRISGQAFCYWGSRGTAGRQGAPPILRRSCYLAPRDWTGFAATEVKRCNTCPA